MNRTQGFASSTFGSVGQRATTVAPAFPGSRVGSGEGQRMGSRLRAAGAVVVALLAAPFRTGERCPCCHAPLRPDTGQRGTGRAYWDATVRYRCRGCDQGWVRPLYLELWTA